MRNIITSALLVIVLIGTGCRRDQDPPATPAPPVDHQEVITSLIMTFVDVEPNVLGLNETFTLRYTDIDGPGGQEPTVEWEPIPAGRYFNVTTRVLDESVSPHFDHTNRIVTQGVDHQFFFTVEGVNVVFSNLNTDANGHPIGTTLNAQTIGTGEGILRVELRHGPDKTAENVSIGDITNAGGETRISAEFPLHVY